MWYFKHAAMGRDGSLVSIGAPVCTGSRLALTRSFGSIALCALVMSVCEMLRRMARRSSRNNGVLGVMIACCLQCLLTYIEFLSRFALTVHSLTGAPFCEAARTFTSHVSHHGFTALGVDSLARFVLGAGAVFLAALPTAITLKLADDSLAEGHSERTAVLAAVGGFAYLAALLVLYLSVPQPDRRRTASARRRTASARRQNGHEKTPWAHASDAPLPAHPSRAASRASFSTSSTHATRAWSSISITARRSSRRWPTRSSPSSIQATSCNSLMASSHTAKRTPHALRRLWHKELR